MFSSVFLDEPLTILSWRLPIPPRTRVQEDLCAPVRRISAAGAEEPEFAEFTGVCGDENAAHAAGDHTTHEGFTGACARQQAPCFAPRPVDRGEAGAVELSLPARRDEIASARFSTDHAGLLELSDASHTSCVPLASEAAQALRRSGRTPGRLDLLDDLQIKRERRHTLGEVSGQTIDLDAHILHARGLHADRRH